MRRKYIVWVAVVLVIALVSTATVAVLRFRARTATAAETASQRKILFVPPAQKLSLPQLKRAVTTNPRNASAWADLGNFHLRNRDFLDAIDAYQKALAIDPKLSRTWSALGEAQIQIGSSTGPAMPAAAKTAFAKALAIDPSDMRSHFYLIMEKDFAGRHDEAIGEWLRMLQAAPVGSDADDAIRAALAASINRNLTQIKIEMNRIGSLQPRAVQKDDPAS